jgi:subtilisin family serine protease
VRGGGALHGLAAGATIVPVRVSERVDTDGVTAGPTVSGQRLADAIDWAADPDRGDASVINVSAVLGEDDPEVRVAVQRAVAAGVVDVAAAGNQGDKGNPTPYPAAYRGVIGVGAIGSDGTVRPYSQRGSYVDIVAPGDQVTVANQRRGHRLESGTSYATPFVSATVALIRQRFPHLSPAEVERRLKATADPAPGGPAYGSGVLNPYRAVTETVLDEAAPAQQSEAAAPPMESAADAAVRQRADRDRLVAVRLAVAGAIVLFVVLVIAVIVPRGHRRGWRAADPG